MFKNQALKLRDWFEAHATTKAADFWLFVISFTESSFFPIPPDPFLAIMAYVKENRWLYYGFFVTIASILGGLFGYFIGFAFYEFVGQPIVDLYNVQNEFEYVKNLFAENTFWTIFTAAFTPIPYKIFTIAAGVAHVNILTFIIASIFGRGIRFILVAFIKKKYGQKMFDVFFKYFNIITITIVVMIIIYILFNIVV